MNIIVTNFTTTDLDDNKLLISRCRDKLLINRNQGVNKILNIKDLSIIW